MTNVTRSVLDALRRDLYPPPRYVWAEEVPVGDRRVDAAVIDTGIEWAPVIGFEAKVSRSDFLNDKSGEKSLPAREFFDAFWFVTGAPGIIKPGELPFGAGLIEIVDGEAVVEAHASVHEPGGPVDRGVARAPLGAVLRCTSERRDAKFLADVERRAFEKGQAVARSALRRGDRSGRRHSDHVKADLDDGLPLDLP